MGWWETAFFIEENGHVGVARGAGPVADGLHCERKPDEQRTGSGIAGGGGGDDRRDTGGRKINRDDDHDRVAAGRVLSVAASLAGEMTQADIVSVLKALIAGEPEKATLQAGRLEFDLKT